MSEARANEVAGYLKAVPKHVVAVLLFGPDSGGVRDGAASLVKKIAGSTDDPFNVVRLTEKALSETPSLLADEVQALSMMGGRRAIWLSEPGNASISALETYLENPIGDGFVVVQAGNLAKGSGLRKLFEKSPNAIGLPFYAESAGNLGETISRLARSAGFSIENEAVVTLTSLLGADQALTKSEMEKLALYCFGRESITLDDVLAVSADASGIGASDPVVAAFAGDIGKTSSQLAQAIVGGASPSGILSVAGQHAARLRSLRLEMNRGLSADRAVKASRPPIFFQRQPVIIRQLRVWDWDGLNGAAETIYQAILQCRQQPALELATAERCLLAIGRRAQIMQSRKN